VGLEIQNQSDTGPLRFRVFSEQKSYEYEVVFAGDKVHYRASDQDIQIHFGKKYSARLSDFFQDEPPVFYFDNGGFLIYNWRFSRNRSPFSSQIDHHSPVVDHRDRSEATLAF